MAQVISQGLCYMDYSNTNVIPYISALTSPESALVLQVGYEICVLLKLDLVIVFWQCYYYLFCICFIFNVS